MLYGLGKTQAISRIVVTFRATAKVSLPTVQVQERSQLQT